MRPIYEDVDGFEAEDVEEQADRVLINPELGHVLLAVPENGLFVVYKAGGMSGFDSLGAGVWKEFVEAFATEQALTEAYPKALWRPDSVTKTRG